MHLLQRSASRAASLLLATTRSFTPISPKPAPQSIPWICISYKQQPLNLSPSRHTKQFSTSFPRHNAGPPTSPPSSSDTSTSSYSNSTQNTTASAAALPSHKAQKRGEMSDQMTRLVNNILTRASVAGHHINAYTGTDYSGIDALRKKIIEEETNVVRCYEAVEAKKVDYHEQFSKQTNSQKEIVSLLERKSSWLPADLERYMSLVRSEHTNDQSVQAAKTALDAAERDLATARSLLEKFERQQYHEEQIWSDTIRRNSTWVTFGLMGVNIVLLLAQILIFEPYRRKKIVRDVKEALDQQTLTVAAFGSERSNAAEVPTSPSDESIAVDASTQTIPIAVDAQLQELGRNIDASHILPEEAVYNQEPSLTDKNSSDKPLKADINLFTKVRAAFWDLFSDRLISIRQVDVTALVARSLIAGIASTALAFTWINSR